MQLEGTNTSHYISLEKSDAFDAFVNTLHQYLYKVRKDDDVDDQSTPETGTTAQNVGSMVDPTRHKVQLLANIHVRRASYMLKSKHSEFLFELFDSSLNMATMTSRKELSLTIGSAQVQVHHNNHKKLLVTTQSSSTEELKNSTLTSQRFVKLLYTEYDQRHPFKKEEYHRTCLDVEFNILRVFWEPVYMSELAYTLAQTSSIFVQTANQKESDTGFVKQPNFSDLEESHLETRQHLSDMISKKSSDLKLLKASVRIKQVSMTLCTPETDVQMSVLSLTGLHALCAAEEDSTKLDCSLQNFTIVDLTNNPYTIKTKQENVEPVELLGVDIDAGKPMMELYISLLGDDNPEVQDSYYSCIRAKVNGVRVNYMQQPFLRTINYLSTYIAGVSVPSGSGSKNTCSYSTAVKTLSQPKLTALQIEILNTSICFRHLPKAASCLVVDLKALELRNQHILEEGGLLEQRNDVKQLYREEQVLELKSLSITRANSSGERNSILEDFQFSAKLSQLRYYNELQVVITHELGHASDPSPLENERHIHCSMSALKLKLLRADYIELVDLLSYNIGHNDGQDVIFTPKLNVVDQSLLAMADPPKEESRGSKNIELSSNSDSLETPITLNLVIEEISLMLWDEVQSMPLFKLEFLSSAISMVKRANRSAELTINFEAVSGYRYEKGGEDEVLEIGVLSVTQDLRQVTLTRSRSLQVATSKLEVASSASDDVIRLKSRELAKNFRISARMSPLGDKVTDVDIQEVKLVLHAADILRVSEFVAYKPEDLPNTAPGVVQGGGNIEMASERLSSSAVQLTVHAMFVCLPSSGKSCPVISSNIMLSSTQFDVLSIIKHTLKNKQFVNYSSVGGIAQKNEVFICELDDFVHNRDVAAVKKRSIMLPFSLSLNMKEGLCGVENGNRIMVRREKTITIDKIVLRVASKDLILLLKCIEHQQHKNPIKQHNSSPSKTSETSKQPAISKEALPLARHFDVFQEEAKIMSKGLQLVNFY